MPAGRDRDCRCRRRPRCVGANQRSPGVSRTACAAPAHHAAGVRRDVVASRLPPSRAQHACRRAGRARAQRRRTRRMRARPAEQQRGARLRQLREDREIAARLRQPRVVDRMQAAEQRDDVVAAQAVVLGRDHEVPVARVDARIEDLHRARAAFAQQARGQRGLAAAADRELRRCVDQRGRTRGRTRVAARATCAARPSATAARGAAIHVVRGAEAHRGRERRAWRTLPAWPSLSVQAAVVRRAAVRCSGCSFHRCN